MLLKRTEPLFSSKQTRPRARVTLIVLAYKSAKRLTACLDAVYADPLAPPLDLRIVLNDVPTAECDDVRKRYPDAVLLPSRVNLGFGSSCNYAARRAQSEFLVLLNDDAIPEPGWLSALLRCADRNIDAAAVGSRILFPDGRLQEAGCVAWSDGSTEAAGRGQAPGTDNFNAVREVDFCSANGLLIRTGDWATAGGFDEEYYPAYYEDVDLCFAFRHKLSRRVLYEPRSVIRHAESASSKAELRTFLFRKHQTYFSAKWGTELRTYLPPRSSITEALFRARNASARVLIIDDRFPDAALGSGFGRFTRLAEECGRDLALTFVATAERPRSVPVLQDAGVETAGIERLDEVLKLTQFDAALISRPHNYAACMPRVLRRQPEIKCIYDAEALFHIRLARQGLAKQAQAMAAMERKIVESADLVICTSFDEEADVRRLGGKSTFVQLPLDPQIKPSEPGFGARAGILFAAAWLAGSESPNLPALEWLVERVMPEVWLHQPSAEVYVTGANPPLQALSLAGERVHLTGYVDDLRALYEKVRVAVAPLLAGAGTKIKTVEALQYAVPFVCTSVGAEGFPAGAHDAMSIADDAHGFAREVLQLYGDEVFWTTRRRQAIDVSTALMESRPSWHQILGRIIRA